MSFAATFFVKRPCACHVVRERHALATERNFRSTYGKAYPHVRFDGSVTIAGPLGLTSGDALQAPLEPWQNG